MDNDDSRQRRRISAGAPAFTLTFALPRADAFALALPQTPLVWSDKCLATDAAAVDERREGAVFGMIWPSTGVGGEARPAVPACEGRRRRHAHGEEGAC